MGNARPDSYEISRRIAGDYARPAGWVVCVRCGLPCCRSTDPVADMATQWTGIWGCYTAFGADGRLMIRGDYPDVDTGWHPYLDQPKWLHQSCINGHELIPAAEIGHGLALYTAGALIPWARLKPPIESKWARRRPNALDFWAPDNTDIPINWIPSDNLHPGASNWQAGSTYRVAIRQALSAVQRDERAGRLRRSGRASP